MVDRVTSYTYDALPRWIFLELRRGICDIGEREWMLGKAGFEAINPVFLSAPASFRFLALDSPSQTGTGERDRALAPVPRARARDKSKSMK